jgi:SAM-dependent methyltransferase
MSIDYDHNKNPHTPESPRVALPLIFSEWKPASLLDVGCGTGTWLQAALEFGIATVAGVDGIQVAQDQFLVSPNLFAPRDLTAPLNLGRKFDAALCLEVGEHLDSRHAETLVESLTAHADFVVFSAACPGQPGQHHVNCQWPVYWQRFFNQFGFVCGDSIRWRLWDVEDIQPWYRQNIFTARRDPGEAGKEKRIEPVVHPDMLPLLMEACCTARQSQIEKGALPFRWYLSAPFKAITAKVLQRMSHR